MRIKIQITLLFLLLVSCQFFKQVDEQEAVARVQDSYLYKTDIEGLIPENTSSEDSTLLVNNYINTWATQQLLVDGATINLSENQQVDFNALVSQYRRDLYSKAYLEALVKKNIDTVVSVSEAEAYYNNNKENFKLNEDLIKFRYIHLNENRLDLEDVKKKFKRFDEEDRKELDSTSIQFKSYSFNDSIWIKVSQVMHKISILDNDNKDELLKKSNFIQLKDSLGLYLMQINDVLLRKETAPLEYVKPTIDQIVINRRKLELIKQLKKDITKDAIKNDKFEIFN